MMPHDTHDASTGGSLKDLLFAFTAVGGSILACLLVAEPCCGSVRSPPACGALPVNASHLVFRRAAVTK
jgi:hypothetical protein